MQLPFYVKSGSDRYIVVAIVTEARLPTAEEVTLQNNGGSWGVKPNYGQSGNRGPDPVHKFVACRVEVGSGTIQNFTTLDLWNCAFDGLVENCLMCGAPKADGAVQS